MIGRNNKRKRCATNRGVIWGRWGLPGVEGRGESDSARADASAKAWSKKLSARTRGVIGGSSQAAEEGCRARGPGAPPGVLVS